MAKPAQHPNRRRALAAAQRSGMDARRLAAMPPAQRQQILDGLNSGSLVLIQSGSAQFIAPAQENSDA